MYISQTFWRCTALLYVTLWQSNNSVCFCGCVGLEHWPLNRAHDTLPPNIALHLLLSRVMPLFVPIFEGCAWTENLFLVINSFRDTSRSQRDWRSQKWSYRSPFMEWRYSIPRQKWVMLFGRCFDAERNQIPTAKDGVCCQSSNSGWIMNVVAFVVFQDVLHNCQLHRISFCADDKTDKRIFTFICKDSESNKHLCYVFDSEKCVGVICLCLFVLFF